MQRDVPSAFPVTITAPIRWVDLDVHGVVNHTVYLTMIEQARCEYFRRLGLMHPGELFPFLLVETTAQYRAPGRLGMEFRAGVRTVRLGRSSFEMEGQVFSGSDRTLLVSTRATLVYVDEEQRSIPIPEEDRGVIRAFEGVESL